MRDSIFSTVICGSVKGLDTLILFSVGIQIVGSLEEETRQTEERDGFCTVFSLSLSLCVAYWAERGTSRDKPLGLAVRVSTRVQGWARPRGSPCGGPIGAVGFGTTRIDDVDRTDGWD